MKPSEWIREATQRQIRVTKGFAQTNPHLSGIPDFNEENFLKIYIQQIEILNYLDQYGPESKEEDSSSQFKLIINDSPETKKNITDLNDNLL